METKQTSPSPAAAATVIQNEVVDSFRAGMRGAVLRPGDHGYDEARRVWSGMIDKRPALIARCTGAADVIAAVNFAREHNLLVAVHGGGHNVAGHATCDGGLMIDLSPMKGIHIDPRRHTAQAQGGATWGDLDRETQVFGLAAPGGVVSTTGIAGLTLGGGYGWLRRKYGLSCDNLLSIDIVTADGRLLTASETDNAELFWAIRGGGGNFGVVTSFEYQLHPVGPLVMFLAVMYPARQAQTILPAWRDVMATAPDEFSSNALFLSIPETPMLPAQVHGQRVFAVVGMYAGAVEEGQRFVQPLRELAEPLFDLSGPMPYTVVQSLLDSFYPAHQYLHYWKSLYLNHLDEEAIATLTDWADNRPAGHGSIDLWAMGGAASRVGADATALGDRSAPFTLVWNTTWSDPNESEKNIAWTRACYQAMQPYSPGRSYLNFPGFGEEGDELVRMAYGPNYDRLVRIKNSYDPSNLFRLNQNIKPAV